jgi:hypothetical protein
MSMGVRLPETRLRKPGMESSTGPLKRPAASTRTVRPRAESTGGTDNNQRVEWVSGRAEWDSEIQHCGRSARAGGSAATAPAGRWKCRWTATLWRAWWHRTATHTLRPESLGQKDRLATWWLWSPRLS